MTKSNPFSSPGRPAALNEETMLCVSGSTASNRLQANSDRRAVVIYLVDCGGCATLGNINAWFGFDCRRIVRDLLRNGWMEAIEL